MSDAAKILLVDDEPNVLSAYQRALRKDFDLHLAEGGEEALEKFDKLGPFTVVVSDQTMPGMDGVTLLKTIHQKAPMTVRIMLTGNADQRTAAEAVNEGNVFRFLSKPCSPDQLAAAVRAAIEHHRLLSAEKELLEKTLAGSVKLLVDVLSLTNPMAFTDIGRQRRWAAKLAKELQIGKAWELDLAVMLAPIGRVTLPAELIAKFDSGHPLTAGEEETLAHAAEAGARLIGHIPRLAPVAEAVLYQNRGYNGTGVPFDGKSGAEIPLLGRLLAILKDLAAASDEERPTAKAFARLAGQAKRYDPELLVAVRRALVDETAPVQPSATHEIPLDRAMIGDVLMEDICSIDGKLVLSAGYELSATMLERIRQISRVKKLREPIKVRREKPLESHAAF